MSNIHVLEGNGNDYRAVLHIAIPVENNAVGVPLRTAIVNAGLAATVLPSGTGAGQITNAERTQVLNGEVLEVVFSFKNNPAWTGPQRLAQFNQEVTNRAVLGLAQIRSDLAYFGHSQ